MNKRYDEYSVEDFVNDERFWKWVTDPNPDVQRYWEGILEAQPHVCEAIAEACRIVEKLNAETHDLDQAKANQLWNTIYQTTQKAPSTESQAEREANTVIPRRSWLSSWTRVAAIVVGVALAGLAYLWNINRGYQETHTAYGETQTITLPDHSEVIVNANSSIRYQRNWDTGKVRQVWLQGEALFKVKHLSQHQPFIVHTGDLRVQVVGTTFNIANRRGKTKVVLDEGKVNVVVDEASQPLQMKPGDLIEVANKGQRITRKLVDPAYYTAWTTKKLTFKETPLGDIFDLLEDVYGYTITIAQPDIAKLQFNGTVSAQKPAILLEALGIVHHLTIQQEGKTIHISK